MLKKEDYTIAAPWTLAPQHISCLLENQIADLENIMHAFNL